MPVPISILDSPHATRQNSGMTWITETKDGVVLNIHASPRASRNEIQGEHGNALKIRLKAPPVDGKANETLIEFLAELLGVPRRHVTLISGQTSRQKRVAVRDMTKKQTQEILKNKILFVQ
jgi:uncharacterized protein (TIGR00251 family)